MLFMPISGFVLEQRQQELTCVEGRPMKRRMPAWLDRGVECYGAGLEEVEEGSSGMVAGPRGVLALAKVLQRWLLMMEP